MKRLFVSADPIRGYFDLINWNLPENAASKFSEVSSLDAFWCGSDLLNDKRLSTSDFSDLSAPNSCFVIDLYSLKRLIF